MRGHRTDGAYRRCPDNDASEDRSGRFMTEAEEEAEWAEQERERAEALCQMQKDAEAEAAYQKQQGE
jgi:hypothetical protein